MSKSKLLLEKEVSVNSIFGHQVVPERIVLAGMKSLEKELGDQFKVQQQQQSELAKMHKSIHQPFLDTLAGNEKMARSVKSLKELSMKQSKTNVAMPRGRKEQQRIFSGSIGATVAPPFNYQWTWNAFNGTVDVRNTSANAAAGTMGINIASNNQCNASARAAVGIYFRPVVGNGILRINSNPSFNDNWFDICAFDSCHTDGFIGLYVGKYNLSGGFVEAPVNQQISLWNDSSWWSGGQGNGGNSGFPLSAQINVDSSHWYAIWIWCGGNIQADGWGVFSGSGAGATLNVAVPSITWELF